MRPITALTFDLDDTFWDNAPVMARTETGHYDWLHERVGHAEHFPLEEYQRRRLAFAARHPVRRGDFTWVRRETLREMLVEFGLEAADAAHWAEAAIERMLALRHEIEVFEEVPAMLDALGQRYRLGAITNGNVDLTRLAIGRHFPVIINAGESLAPKPDARPFLAALARLGPVPPSQGLHVGDSWREDVLPARRLGMRVAWIDKDDERPASLPEGVYRLGHIRELPALLDGLEG
ncbi:HAD family hydrolase [Modicisalibacter tunisiensis]|uniref:HAD-IA family hydrolase n=1 Tax=Modicisalibacter tunisiensis TaxID=390637 RepID=A0ABS7WX14_9GAMM|nr:HAD-IA family hydrolase [Modicisalibacter tunisiensis]MBZ9566699.1 HAD-IA family hydrolase [Modicisalibacter tunisiensis]